MLPFASPRHPQGLLRAIYRPMMYNSVLLTVQIPMGVLNPSHRSKVTVRRRTTLVRLADRSKLLGILLAPQLRPFHITQRAMHSTRFAPSKGHGSFDLSNFPLPPAPKHASWKVTAPIIGVISFYGPHSLWILTSVTAYKHVQQCSAGIGDAF